MIIFDANAIIAIIHQTAEGKALSALILEGEQTCAPQIIATEVSNALWQYLRRDPFKRDSISEVINSALSLIDSHTPDSDLLVEATSEALRLNHPVYDMLYFVLARRTAGTLFTLDRKLQQVCLDNGVNCVCAMDLPPVTEGE